MARSSESFQKRAREKARLEKKAEKRAKRQSGSADDDGSSLSRVEEDALMQEYATLSARYESEEISTEHYNDERHRIFVELGLESDS